MTAVRQPLNSPSLLERWELAVSRADEARDRLRDISRDADRVRAALRAGASLRAMDELDRLVAAASEAKEEIARWEEEAETIRARLETATVLPFRRPGR